MTEPIKSIKSEIWFFDIETVPCVETGKKVYPIIYDPEQGEPSDADILSTMYYEAGQLIGEQPPMLKTLFQRVVAISALVRKETATGVALSIHSLPTNENFDERTIIETFLNQIGTRRPQIVGFNHSGFDIPVLFQRALIHGIDLRNFCDRPEKPWDAKPDYFNDKNEWNVDLMKLIGAWGKGTPSLSEIAKACGIPAKIHGDGGDVLDMWTSGRRTEIVNYCELDVLATYLLWLRTARVSGLFGTETLMFPEEEYLRQVLIDSRDAKPHLGEFLDVWDANGKTMEVAA